MTDPIPSRERDEQQDEKWYDKTRYQILLFVAGTALFVFVLGLILDWYIEPKNSTQKKDLVQALGLITAGVAGAVGIYFTWRSQRLSRKAQVENQQNTLEQLKDADEQLSLSRKAQEDNQRNTQKQLEQARNELDITRQGQITERFTRAVDQLGATHDNNGAPKLETRIGGIHALARIAEDSEDVYYWPVIEVLTAYVRTNVPWSPKAASKPDDNSEHEEDWEEEAKLSHQHRRIDVQAILDILTDRKHHYDRGEDKYIWLTYTDLRYALLRNVNLERARLRGANLKRARLENAHLRRARLRNAILDEANLKKAQLQGADLEEVKLRKANLEGTNLRKGDLEKADLGGAMLRGADLQGANLQGAIGLTQGKLEQAFGDVNTKLPEGLGMPKSWRRRGGKAKHTDNRP